MIQLKKKRWWSIHDNHDYSVRLWLQEFGKKKNQKDVRTQARPRRRYRCIAHNYTVCNSARYTCDN